MPHKPFPSFDGTYWTPLMVEMLLSFYSHHARDDLHWPAQTAAVEYLAAIGLLNLADYTLTSEGHFVAEQLLKHAAYLTEVLS